MHSYLLVYFAWLLLLFAVGYLVSKFLANAPAGNFYSTVLRNIFAGYVTIIIAFSIFYTGFKTVNIVLLIIAGLICFESRKKHFIGVPASPEFRLRHVVTIMVVAMICFLIPWMTISNSESYLQFFYKSDDYTLYSRISKSLLMNGQENGFGILNSLDPYYTNPEPYHFFDLWGGAAVSRIFSVNVYPALMVIIYPTFYLLCFAGYMTLLRRDNVSAVLLAFAFLWVGGITPDFFGINLFVGRLTDNVLSPESYKVSFYYSFLISAFLLYRVGYIAIAVLVCLGLPVATIITLPTIVPSLLVFLALAYVFSHLDRKELVSALVYVLLVVCAIVLFYLLNQRETAGLGGAEITKPLSLIKSNLAIANLSAQRNVLIKGIGMLLIVYSPYVALIMFYTRRSTRKILGFFPVIVVGISLLVWTALFRELNAVQIFKNITVPIVNITIVILLCQMANSYRRAVDAKIPFIVAFSLVAIAIVFQVSFTAKAIKHQRTVIHDEGYLQGVEARVAPNSIIGSIKSVKKMTHIWHKYNAVYPMGPYLLLQDKNCFAVNICDLSTPMDSTSAMNLERSQKAVRDGIFYRYSKLPENTRLNEEELMAKFVKQYNIRYLLVEKRAKLPPLFEKRAKSILVDPLSGERLVELQ